MLPFIWFFLYFLFGGEMVKREIWQKCKNWAKMCVQNLITNAISNGGRGLSLFCPEWQKTEIFDALQKLKTTKFRHISHWEDIKLFWELCWLKSRCFSSPLLHDTAAKKLGIQIMARFQSFQLSAFSFLPPCVRVRRQSGSKLKASTKFGLKQKS